MKRYPTSILSFMFFFLCLFINPSCTIIGFGIGAAADKGKETESAKTIPGWGVVEELKVGSKIHVFKKDGSNIKGKYERLLQVPINGDIFPVMVMQTNATSMRRIAIQHIDYVITEARKPQGKKIGLLVGGFIDGLAILAISGSDFSPRSSQSSNLDLSSCPFIYSYDGTKYRLDGEIFGGAIFQAAQRHDWDNLDHVWEVDGKYHLKITNELEETQYVDELKLLVIDHPKGTQVFPSFNGKIHLIEHPNPPLKAVNKYGSDILPYLKETDTQQWVSHPFGLNAAEPSDGRDWVDLTFSKPASSKRVRLIFNVQNTVWGSYMQRIMIDLHGDQQEAWYHQLNTSEVARKELMGIMIREGMMLIKVWDGHTWLPGGFVWEVGPAIAKDIVEMVNIKDVQGEELKIRLEYPVGFWQINSVQADFHSNKDEIKIAEISPEKMITHKGEDLLELISNNDQNYYIMPDTSYAAKISFAAPLKDPGLNRTFLLKSSGYYTIHPTGEGPPKTELFNQLKQQPGAYAQFSLRQLDKHVKEALNQLEKLP